MEGTAKQAPVHADEGLALKALRWHLERRERQLGDLAWQLTELAAMGASPAERRRELARLRAWAREAADEFKGHIATSEEEERLKVVETASAAETSREDAAPQSETESRAAATVTAPEEATAEAAVSADTLAEPAEPVEALHDEPATAAEASRDDGAPQSETGNCAAATATAPEEVEAEAAVPADTPAESAEPVDAPRNEPATAAEASGELVAQQGDTAASETATEAVAEAATSAETPTELAEPVESFRNEPGDAARLERVETSGAEGEIASVDQVTEAAGLATSAAGAEAVEAGAEAGEAAAEAAEVAAVAEAAAAAEVAGIVRSTDGEEASESLQLPSAASATHTGEVASVVEAAEAPAQPPGAAPAAAERSAAVEAEAPAAEAAAAEQGLDSEEEDGGSEPEQQLWEVVGGANAGGILVRDGVALTSQQESERLQVGAVVRELQLDGERLHYELRSGMGPRTGWVSVKVKERELLRRRDPSRNVDFTGPQARLILWPRGQRRRKWKGPHTQFTKVCVMGPFNSGTNALMREIPRFFDANVINKHRADNPHWWKHGIQKGQRRAPEDTFFVCLVRDPGYWIQSLARDPADGTFNDLEPVKYGRSKSGAAIYEQQPHQDAGQLFSHILFDGKVYSDALSVWEATVRSYFDEQALPTSQMAVLRYEDYVFRFEEAMRALAQRGLPLKQSPPPFVALSDTAKDHTHPKAARRDLGTTKRDLSNPSRRYAGRTADQKAKLDNMDANLINLLGYGKDAVAKWKD